MRRFALMVLALTALPLAFACLGGNVRGVEDGGGGGGGGGGVGPDLAAFQGTWFGPGDDGGMDPYVVELSINSSGGIANYEIDSNSEDAAIPASFNVTDASSALITFADMAEGWFFWDDAVEHMLFVDPRINNVAALEKNATGPLVYAASDAVASWSGYAYGYSDATGDFEKASPVNLTVENDLAFSGTDPFNQPLSGSFNAALFDSSHGMYVGTINGTPDQSLMIFLSPDMTFSGGITFDPVTAIWPDDFIFVVLARQ